MLRPRTYRPIRSTSQSLRARAQPPSNQWPCSVALPDDSLRALFQSALYTHGLHAFDADIGRHYWPPLLALCMGLRVGEIVALRPSDFDILGSGFALTLSSPALNSATEGRLAPVPHCLLKCGFIEFVLRADEKHQTYLVEIPGRNFISRATRLNQQFARYVERFCAGHPGLTLEALRTTYRSQLGAPECAPVDMSHMYVNDCASSTSLPIH